jgi:hypothetical protein
VIETRYKVGKKEMVIKKHDDGRLDSIEDQDGKKLKGHNPNRIKLTSEDDKFRSTTSNVSDDTVIFTKHNPTCCWYFFGGSWYYICS